MNYLDIYRVLTHFSSRYRKYPSNLVLCLMVWAYIETWGFLWPFMTRGGSLMDKNTKFVSIEITTAQREISFFSKIDLFAALQWRKIVEGY